MRSLEALRARTKDGHAIRVFPLAEGLTKEQADELERKLIVSGRITHRILNITDGGDGATGWVPSAETKAKIGAANSGKKASAETKAKMSAAHKGKLFSQETREKIRKAALIREAKRRAMTTAERAHYIDSIRANSTALLGEILTWNLPENTCVPYQDLLTALSVAGLDQKVAREMRNRHAFARAAKQLAADRIIRCTDDAEHEMTFQFTKEYLDQSAGQFRYNYETAMKLDKDTGRITLADVADAIDPNLVQLKSEAQRLLEKAKGERLTADISRIIMTLFEKQADLFPVRAAGGVYFVPERHSAFIDKIETLVNFVHGTVTRFPVPAGTQQGNKSVKVAVTEGLQTLIDEHLANVADFGSDTRESTMQKHLAKIEQTAFKIEAYADYLEEQRDALKANLATVKLSLRQKIQQVIDAKEAVNA